MVYLDLTFISCFVPKIKGRHYVPTLTGSGSVFLNALMISAAVISDYCLL